jgi:hypothetical protein
VETPRGQSIRPLVFSVSVCLCLTSLRCVRNHYNHNSAVAMAMTIEVIEMESMISSMQSINTSRSLTRSAPPSPSLLREQALTSYLPSRDSSDTQSPASHFSEVRPEPFLFTLLTSHLSSLRSLSHRIP